MTRPPNPVLKKRLGQHHLRDGGLCRPLLEFLEPAGARVVEIGPGGGVLTAALLDAGARVIGLELDREWAFVLRRRHPECRVVVADALDVAWDRLPAPTLVAGNLPFNVIMNPDGCRGPQRGTPSGNLPFAAEKKLLPGSAVYGEVRPIPALRGR